MTDPYSPSPELAYHVAGYRPDRALEKAVAFRHPDGHPELVPWDEYSAEVQELAAELIREREQVRELVHHLEAVCYAYEWTLKRPENTIRAALHLPLIDARAALAPFTQEPG